MILLPKNVNPFAQVAHIKVDRLAIFAMIIVKLVLMQANSALHVNQVQPNSIYINKVKLNKFVF